MRRETRSVAFVGARVVVGLTEDGDRERGRVREGKRVVAERLQSAEMADERGQARRG